MEPQFCSQSCSIYLQVLEFKRVILSHASQSLILMNFHQMSKKTWLSTRTYRLNVPHA